MPRTKEFDPEVALDKAMHVFWHKGYEATSMEDLLEAMDLNRGSLYDTFGDKRQLFLKALERYCGGISGRIRILEQPGSALSAIRTFIETMAAGLLADPARRGCLLVNTAMELAPHEKEVGAQVSRVVGFIEESFFNALSRAKKQGELKKGQDPRALARYLTGMMQGLVVMYKAGASPAAVHDILNTGLSVLDV